MPPENAESRPWPAPLAGRIAGDADAVQVADAVVAVWREIDRALHPIIGHGGVAALHNRSVRLTAPAYPWLAAGHQGALAAVDVTALRAALLPQPAAQAAAGGIALFQSFRELLASLVGAALADQLLHPVWAHPAGVSPAQDISK